LIYQGLAAAAQRMWHLEALLLQQDVDFQNEKHKSIYAPTPLANNFHLHLQLTELPVRQSSMTTKGMIMRLS
jgi:hypothetical protein